jgi:hypothetical protein
VLLAITALATLARQPEDREGGQAAGDRHAQVANALAVAAPTGGWRGWAEAVSGSPAATAMVVRTLARW